MKRLLKLVTASALMGALPSAALAAPITFTDTLTPAPHVCLSLSAPAACRGEVAPSIGAYSFTFDLIDNGFDIGSLITAAEITLILADDGGPGDGNEKLGLLVDSTAVPHNGDVNHDALITLSDFSSLANDGTMVVVVSATSGDFFLNGARLTVVAEPPPAAVSAPPPTAAAVPAPAALVLLGAGLAGAAWTRRAAR